MRQTALGRSFADIQCACTIMFATRFVCRTDIHYRQCAVRQLRYHLLQRRFLQHLRLFATRSHAGRLWSDVILFFYVKAVSFYLICKSRTYKEHMAREWRSYILCCHQVNYLWFGCFLTKISIDFLRKFLQIPFKLNALSA